MNIDFYDPEMCCSTGVCGPSPDAELIRVSEVVEQLKSQGHSVSRYMLSRNPVAFSANKAVYQEILQSGTKVLPIVVVDGKVAFKGTYPSVAQVLTARG